MGESPCSLARRSPDSIKLYPWLQALKLEQQEGLLFILKLGEHTALPLPPFLVPREVIDGHKVAWEGGQEISVGWGEGDLTGFVEEGTQESQ